MPQVPLRVTHPGRAEVDAAAPDAASLGAALDAAFADDVTAVAWWVPVGDWAARRTAWQLGFSYGGVLRGWSDGADAWAFTLRHDDPREPRTPWLDNPVIEGAGVRLRPFTDADVPRVVEVHESAGRPVLRRRQCFQGACRACRPGRLRRGR